jgi:hypothetical protein
MLLHPRPPAPPGQSAAVVHGCVQNEPPLPGKSAQSLEVQLAFVWHAAPNAAAAPGGVDASCAGDTPASVPAGGGGGGGFVPVVVPVLVGVVIVAVGVPVGVSVGVDDGEPVDVVLVAGPCT